MQAAPRLSLAKLGNRFSISVERLQAQVARARVDDDTEYIAVLARVFDVSQFVGKRTDAAGVCMCMCMRTLRVRGCVHPWLCACVCVCVCAHACHVCSCVGDCRTEKGRR
jgi:hypothetical protein